MRFAGSFFLGVVLASSAGMIDTASAAPITTLYNTGVDDSGAVLPDGTVPDPHYTLVSVPSGSSSSVRVKTAALLGSWSPVTASSISGWIAPNNGPSVNSPVGDYVYSTTFNLSGLKPGTAQIMGAWSIDNYGFDIRLNGVSLGITLLPPTPNLSSQFHPFTIDSHFIAGINTLEFVVRNGGQFNNPTGLRVEMTGTADRIPLQIPEIDAHMSTAALVLLAGALGLLYDRKRRGQSR